MEENHSGVIKAEDIKSGFISGVQQEQTDAFGKVCKLIHDKKYQQAKEELEKCYEVSEMNFSLKMHPEAFFTMWSIIDMNLK